MIKSDIAGDVRGKIGYVLNIFIDTAMRNIYPRSPLSVGLYQRSYTANAKFLVSFSFDWYKKKIKNGVIIKAILGTKNRSVEKSF